MKRIEVDGVDGGSGRCDGTADHFSLWRTRAGWEPPVRLIWLDIARCCPTFSSCGLFVWIEQSFGGPKIIKGT